MAASPVLRAMPEAGPSWDDPSEDQLLKLLENIEAGEGSFLIVERTTDPTGNTYAQVKREKDGSYLVEHRDGDEDHHYGTVVPDMRAAHRLLTGWAFQHPGWADRASWSQPWVADARRRGSAQAAAGQQGVLPGPGHYQIRTRWLGVVAGLFITALGIVLISSPPVGPGQIAGAVVFFTAGMLIAVPWLIALARGKVAFRADRAGITLGPAWPLIKSSAVFFAWADVSRITFYTITRPGPLRRWPGDYLGIVPRRGSQAGGASLRLVAWPLWYQRGSPEHRKWLNRERLEDIAAAAAPGVHITDAGDINPWDDTGQRFLSKVGRWP